MALHKLLTPDEVREFVSDYPENNHLIEGSGEEFSNTFINLCMALGVEAYNSMPPYTRYDLAAFPSKTVLLYATLWQMYEGKAVLLARNTMNYSDGGIQIPIEERAELYKNLANGFKINFQELARPLKIQTNMDSGWGSLSSDESMFPNW